MAETPPPIIAPQTVRIPPGDVIPTFANYVSIQVNSQWTRLTFGEEMGGEIRYHAASTMPTDGALNLARLIIDLTKTSAPDLYKQFIAQLLAAHSNVTTTG